MSCLASRTTLLVLFLLLSRGALQNQARELRCQCVKVISHGISTALIASVDFIPEGPHCIRPEVILTRKDGKQFCLNTTMPWVQRVIQRFSKRSNL
ncbi:PREDICTED: interleukin-8-like [Thamnophis sirtalis]|uniref:C-X-C motif chemokine n=1 Tax=Thamnophis sirtalis TaxID=35019 RepID=A0A6I9YHR9_9SAUR|nr:PREDICTED: interleukin-8-like [Thamnophis sirtalis]